MGCRPGQWPCSAGGASARCVHGGGAVSKLLCCHEMQGWDASEANIKFQMHEKGDEFTWVAACLHT
eukprot:scaffold300668_cov19-Tisochrysis_lutea.AAC.2